MRNLFECLDYPFWKLKSTSQVRSLILVSTSLVHAVLRMYIEKLFGQLSSGNISKVLARYDKAANRINCTKVQQSKILKIMKWGKYYTIKHHGWYLWNSRKIFKLKQNMNAARYKWWETFEIMTCIHKICSHIRWNIFLVYTF